MTAPAQAQTSSAQLGTYYSVPFGNYDRLRLVPRAALTGACVPGTMYVNQTAGNTLEFCKADGTWGPITGGFWDKTGNSLYPIDIDDKVAIGTNTAEFRLTVGDADGGIITRGVFGSGDTLTTTGAGTRLIWYPKRSAFRAGRVDGNQWDDTVATPNVGDYSFAAGYGTTASGGVSTALGDHATADGDPAAAMGKNARAGGGMSVAIGENTEVTADGQGSVAFGFGTKASGSHATAMGWGTTAQAQTSLAIGRWNIFWGDTYNPLATDPYFVIGNGSGSGARSNAFTVLKNGQVGINVPNPTTSPLNFKLTLDQGATLPDGGILAMGTYNGGTALTTTGAGTRLIWYPRRAAFRAGYVDGVQWNDVNIGNDSMAFGYNNTARASSVVMGSSNTASVSHAIAIGISNIASASSAIAMGQNVTASAQDATAFGDHTTASSLASTAMGSYSTASGNYATAIGFYATAQAYASLVLGRYNVIAGTTNNWVQSPVAEPVFVIGNGTSSVARSNALTVLKNGDTAIGGVLDTTTGLIVEMRTTDPVAPANGRVWLCTDAGDALPCNGI